MQTPSIPVDVFCSYAQEDVAYWDALERQLSMLRQTGKIKTWHRHMLVAGSDWQHERDRALNAASLILLLVSADFLDADEQCKAELQQAIQRHEAHETHVIPILVRPCDWKDAPFEKLQMLPRNGKPLALWSNLDQGLAEIVEEIRTALAAQPSLKPTTPASGLPNIWQIPYPPNPIFTGREQILQQLAASLQTGKTTALTQPQAISGLGGIGKTQIAIQYAHQHRHEYQAILWSRADTREALISGYVEIAHQLNLPQKDQQDQILIVQAVLRWLQTQKQWLLILDNADDLTIIREFLPPPSTGHILLTTRAQAMGRLAQRIQVETMDDDAGVQLLLRRAGLSNAAAPPEPSTTKEWTLAQAISKELGGLPLALDQAGAYIEETGCGLAAYQRHFRTRRAKMLAERGGLVNDHPEPVATTWSLSFEQVEKRSMLAADLLRVCAFLAPDSIPEEIFTSGASHLGENLHSLSEELGELDDAIRILRAYSLIQREGKENVLSIHRLVQAVLRDKMDGPTQHEWITRVVRAVHATFPKVEHKTWLQCERLLPQALECAAHIEQEQLTLLEAASLLNRAAYYLDDRARYREAEPLYVRALGISEQELGGQHPDTATNLNNLAGLYKKQGKYAEAEKLCERALGIREQELGGQHPDTAATLNNLALLYEKQGKYAEAEKLYVRALGISEQELGGQHPDTATSLNNLALLYEKQGKYGEAEKLHERALGIYEQELGGQHPSTATSLNNLAVLYKNQGKYGEAEELYERALGIKEQELGAQHPSTATSLNNLAALYYAQGKYTDAEPLFQRALTIHEYALGSNHPDTAQSLWWLAVFSEQQQRFQEAALLYERALPIYERTLGLEHSTTQNVRRAYTALLEAMKRDEETT